MSEKPWPGRITDITLDIPAGGTVLECINRMISAAKEKNVNIHAEINDIWVSVSPDDTPSKILNLFHQTQKDLADLEKAKPQTPYHRVVLYLDKKMEIVLITWPKGVRSRPHDHGNSCGFMTVLKGLVFDKTFDKKTKEFMRAGTHNADISKILIESPKQIHIIGNAGREEAVTLHVYMPPLKMKFYDNLA